MSEAEWPIEASIPGTEKFFWKVVGWARLTEDRLAYFQKRIDALDFTKGFGTRLASVEERTSQLWHEVVRPDENGNLAKRVAMLKSLVLEELTPIVVAAEVFMKKLDKGFVDGSILKRLETLEARQMPLPFPASTPTPAADAINPNHYSHPTYPTVQCIDFAEHMGYHLGQAFAYAWRVYLGGQALAVCAQDLKKARWYVKRYLGRAEYQTHVSLIIPGQRSMLVPFGVVVVGIYDVAKVNGATEKAFLQELLVDLDRAIDVFEVAAKSGADPRPPHPRKST